MKSGFRYILAAIVWMDSNIAVPAQESQYIGMPKLLLEQLCEKNDPGCRYFIGGVANTLYYSAKGTICFPMIETNGLKSIDLNPLIETAKYGLSKVAFDQDSAPVLFSIWRAAYPCQK